MRRPLIAALVALAPVLAHAEPLALIAPTAPLADSSKRVANTEWVNNFFNGALPLAAGKIFIGSAGNLATGQTPSGDCTLSIAGVIICTKAAGNFQVIGNLTVGGSIIDGNGLLVTNIAAPASPAAGATRIYVDSTQKVLTFKNDAGTVGNAVLPSTCGANLFGTSISAAGVFGCAQPSVANISGFGTGVATALGVNVGTAGAPVVNGGALGTPSSGTATNLAGTAASLTAGNVTTNANLTGPVTSVGNATAVAANAITDAMLAQMPANTIRGNNTGSTANVADLTLAQARALLADGSLMVATTGINLNSLGDTAIAIPTMPTGFTHFYVWLIDVHNTGTTASLTAAQYGLFTAAGGAGAALVASGTAMSAITSNTANTVGNMLQSNGALASLDATGGSAITNVYFRVTQVQGAAATGDVVLRIRPQP